MDALDRQAHSKNKGHYVRFITSMSEIIECSVEGCLAVLCIPFNVGDLGTLLYTKKKRNAVRNHLKTAHPRLSMREHEQHMATMMNGEYTPPRVMTLDELRSLKW